MPKTQQRFVDQRGVFSTLQKLVTLLAVLCFAMQGDVQVAAQRPHYAGQRPTGYHDRFNGNNVTTVTRDASNNTTNPIAGTSTASAVPLDNRFGSNSISGAPAAPPTRLPTAALGDQALVEYWNQRPVEQRPFWLVNYEAIEAQKNGGVIPAAQSRPQQAATTVAPDLVNRFAIGDDQTIAATVATVSVGVSQQELGSSNDALNYAISKPQIVYALPVDKAEKIGSTNSSTVIMVNGQPFLLTPLVPATSVAVAGSTTPKV